MKDRFEPLPVHDLCVQGQHRSRNGCDADS